MGRKWHQSLIPAFNWARDLTRSQIESLLCCKEPGVAFVRGDDLRLVRLFARMLDEHPHHCACQVCSEPLITDDCWPTRMDLDLGRTPPRQHTLGPRMHFWPWRRSSTRSSSYCCLHEPSTPSHPYAYKKQPWEWNIEFPIHTLYIHFYRS